ncbi:hypothetical protein L7F22_023119 [Adiantum nelumboides]|nr:hypothetical protein [Adiantum nelumboides]
MPVTLPNGAEVVIQDIYHIPGLKRSLLSVNAATSTGSSIEFFNDGCVIKYKLPSGQSEEIRLQQQRRLYPLTIHGPDVHAEASTASALSTITLKEASTLLWHYLLGHINAPTLQRMARTNLCRGLPSSLSPIDLYEGCLLGKARHQPFPRSPSLSSQVNQLVHSDLCGPMETQSITGSFYFATFIDDFSRYTTVYFLKNKSQLFSYFKEYCASAQRQHDVPIQALRSDNGRDYVSNALLQFCKVEGIKHQVTVPYTPQQNGVAERKNGTLVAAARAMMLTANLPKLYWEEAVATSCYLQNRTPHSIDPHNTPYHHWFGRQPNLQHLRVFGCATYAVKAADLRHKLDLTSIRMVLVGYGDRFGIKAYRLYHPQQKKFHFAHSVYFHEGSLLSPQQGDLSTVSNNDALSSPTIPKVNPQTEWEEAEHSLNPIAQVQAPVLPVQPHQSPVAPPNPIPTPQRPVPAWSLGRKTNSLLFPKSPNPLFPGKNIFKRGLLLQPSLSLASSVAEPLAGDVFPHQGSSGSLKQPLPSSTTTPKEIYPDSPVKPLKQPVLLGRPSTPGSMSKLKTYSLKEIYDSSNLAILFDSEVQPPATPNFIAPTSSTNLKVADAFVLQVLHASMNAPFDPGALNSSVEIVDGITVTEAFAGSEADLWQQAMDSEYQSLIDNGTWELVSPPPNRKIVTCKWLLRKKLHADGSVSRYKACLVARGFSQVLGMDYSETFSPMLRITSFRVLIAIAAQFRLLLHQMDVRTAFLHGDLEEEIYMMQPPRYISKEHPDHVCKLIKSLYGLKRSPRQWYRRFHECMTSLGYARFTSEPNIYSRHSPDVFLLLAIYVDDILLLCNSESALATAKKELSSSFSMTDMGLLHFCLGIQVFQDALQGLIKISQQSYIGSLLKKYDMEACKGVDAQLPANLKIKKIDDSDSILTVQPFPYANILGGVHYLVTCTRPDICFAANLLSRFMQSPGAAHIQNLKHLLRYLKHTKNLGLIYRAADPLPSPFLIGYSDADWGGNQDTLQSTSGYVSSFLEVQSRGKVRSKIVSPCPQLKQSMWR